MAGSNQKPLQLKILLEGIRPPIWRRVLVAPDVTLRELHDVIQITMGWTDSHLYMFEKSDRRFSCPDPDGFLAFEDDSIPLTRLIKRANEWLTYTYDFGDGWTHRITLEKRVPDSPEIRLPTCVKGKRACPPEDCGGPWGYGYLLDVLSDPTHEEYAERVEWSGELSPEHFDLEETNAALREYC